MPSMEHKRGRGRGRPKGSGKTDGPSKAVKDHEPVRRSTRGKAAVRSQEDEVEAYEHEYHIHESPAPGGSTAQDSTWEDQRQMMIDENQRLTDKCSDLEANYLGLMAKTSELERSLTRTQNESAVRVQEAINDKEDQVMDLQLKNIALLRRVKEAEEREAQLKREVEFLECGQPLRSAQASSSRTNPPPPPSRPYASATAINLDSSDEDDAAPPRRSQQGFYAPRSTSRREPQRRTRWSDEDENRLLRLIAQHGARYSKIEREWRESFPRRHPRDQKQIKDKARNLKITFLKNNLPLPPRFDEVNIDAKGIDQIKAVGCNPYRTEEDKDERGFPINTLYDEEQDRRN